MSFPDVPPLPGVPALPRDPSAPPYVPPTLLTSDGILPPNVTVGPQWGIFDQDGDPVVIGDSVRAFEYKREFRISDYPQEQGAFNSYNKVATPRLIKLTFTQGGTDQDRAAFLATVDGIVEDLNLYYAVTPDTSYQSMNVTHYDYRRDERNGATLLTVDVWLEEVRQTTQTAFSNTQSPYSQGAVNGGNVQPTEVPQNTFPPPT